MPLLHAGMPMAPDFAQKTDGLFIDGSLLWRVTGLTLEDENNGMMRDPDTWLRTMF